ncbi:hypothetical protein J3R82DRAFT_5136 [Butyriboletus roseoflavus]|nr:hypothetical protein J3R82DRAFT_5136 [Butyriboletus roseoflavus]
MPHVDSDEFSDNNTEIQPNNNFCCDIDKVIKTIQLIQQDKASKHGELNEDEAEGQVCKEALSQITSESREQMIQTYYKILQIVPSLKAIINDPSKCDELATICTKMNGHIKSVCSTDASHLKNSIPHYVLPDTTKPNSLDPPIVISSDQAEMGLNHPILACWLCSADQLEEFDEDSQKAQKDLALGVIPMQAEDFPSLFWSGEMPGSDYNPDDILHRLFRSYFLVQIGQHVFLGPSHAVEYDFHHGHSCNAVLHDMMTMQAEHIAYIYIQAHFRISSLDQWNEIDGNLNYLTMYRAIVHFIQDPINTRWRDDLLKWWNIYASVFLTTNQFLF